MPGIELDDAGQLELLQALAAYQAEAPWADEPRPPLRFFYDNPNFRHGEAVVLYGMIRHLRPARIVEIGSGHSSCVVLDTNERFFGGSIECTFVEPYPELLRSLVREDDLERAKLLEAPLQTIGDDLFRSLQANDILLVDSTHVAKVGSDVNRIVFEVLPLLASGVHVHFHDVYYPFEYPRSWVLRGGRGTRRICSGPFSSTTTRSRWRSSTRSSDSSTGTHSQRPCRSQRRTRARASGCGAARGGRVSFAESALPPRPTWRAPPTPALGPRQRGVTPPRKVVMARVARRTFRGYGGERIRTSEGRADGFTARSLGRSGTPPGSAHSNGAAIFRLDNGAAAPVRASRAPTRQRCAGHVQVPGTETCPEKPRWDSRARLVSPLVLKRKASHADVLGVIDLDQLLKRVVELGGSDIHLKLGLPPVVRRDGELGALDGWQPLGPRPTRDRSRAPDAADRRTGSTSFRRTGELDTSFMAPDLAPLPRQRLQAARRDLVRVPRHPERGARASSSSACRAGVQRLADEHRGLILVTGATGSGKSTTLAAMIDHINRTRRQHIVTIEDPIEFLHADHGCIVNQREVGLDTDSFGQALRRALRQDPDVILIGELRDAETAETALQAAESGHLVLSTHAHRRRGRDGRPHDRVLPGGEAAADPLDPRGRRCAASSASASCRARRRPRRRVRGDGQRTRASPT